MTHPSMQCPRCHGPMRSYPRSGIQLDRCDQCQGIFLDAGELETILRNESPMQGGAMPPGPGPGPGYYPGSQYGAYPNQQQYGPGPGYGGGYGAVWGSTDPNNPAPGPDQQR